MFQTLRSVGSLLLSFGLLLLANGLFGTLLGLRSKLEGFSTEATGLVMAGYSIGLLLGALFAVWVVARVGHIRAFAAFASIMSVAVLSHLLWVDVVVWFLLRIVAGFTMAGMVMVSESWINERAENSVRGQILALYMATNYLGSGLGQLLLNVGRPEDFQLFVIASIIFSIALVPVLLTKASSPKPVAPKRIPIRQLFAISPVGVFGAVCAGTSNASVNTLGPIYAADNALSIAQVSAFMACIILGGMVLQYPIGRLSDRLDRRTILLFVATATGLLALAINWAANDVSWLLFAIATAFGGFAFTLYPLSCAQVNDLARPDQLVQVSAGLLMAYGVGAIAGPIISALLMGSIGSQGLFLFIAGIAGILALFTIFRMTVRSRGETQKTPYLPLGSIGVASKQLYASALNSLLRRRKTERQQQSSNFTAVVRGER